MRHADRTAVDLSDRRRFIAYSSRSAMQWCTTPVRGWHALRARGRAAMEMEMYVLAPDGPRPRFGVMHLGRNGGGPKFTFQLASALAGTGAVVHSIVARGADNRADFEHLGPTLPLITFSSARQALLRSPLTVVHGFKVLRYLRRHDIDVLVVGMEQVWQAPVLVLARFAHRPILLCVHDASMHLGDANKLEAVLRSAQRRLSDGFIAFSGPVTNELRRIVGAGRPVTQSVHAAFGVPRSTARTPSTAVPVVGFFGRLSQYKGLGLGYDAVERLRAEGRRIVFRVVGAGDDDALRRMTHPDDQILLEWTTDEAVPAVLDAFDVLLLPYLEASQSGVLAYAMSSGLPAVVTPVGGLEEQARLSGAAVISEDLTAGAVADAIAELLDDSGRYEASSLAGLRAARGPFSWDRVARDLIDAAQELLRRAARPQVRVVRG